MSGARAGELALRQTQGERDPAGDHGVKQALEAIAAYIPAEALALFVSLYGLLAPTSAELRAILLGVGGVALVLATASGFNFKVNTAPKRRRMLLLVVFGEVAFGAWVIAMPGGPFAGSVDLFGDVYQVTVLGGALVLALAAFMPMIAKGLKLRP